MLMKTFCPRASGRILWREAAEQYTFCIGIFAMLLVMRASLATMETFDMIQPPSVAFHFGMALFMTAIYAAASAALSCGAEVDAGTFVFQRTKPIGWLSYLLGKLSWTVLSTVVLGVAAWLATGLGEGRFPNAHDTSLAFGVCGVGIVEGLAWGLIATLAIRGPLRAVIAGIATSSLVAWVIVVVHHTLFGVERVLVTTAYYQAAGWRLVIAVFVLVTGVLLTRIWYRTGQPIGKLLMPHRPRGEGTLTVTPGQWRSYAQPCRGRWLRLLWQAWRQVRSPAVAYWCCCLIVLVWAGLYYRARMPHSESDSQNDLALGCTVWSAVAILAFSSVLAGYTFGADQKKRFLQLARDGVAPLEIWLSRLIVMATVLLPPALILLGLLRYSMGQLTELPLYQPLAVLLVLFGYASTLVIGQACSMFVRSRIVALLAAPTLIGCFACWIAFSVFWARVDWRLAVAPMLLALLVATRLLAGTRLRQDNSWRAMRRPALLVVAAAFFSYQAFAVHRANEIQPYDLAQGTDETLLGVIGSEQLLSIARSFRSSSRGYEALDSPRKYMKDLLTHPDDGFFGFLPEYMDLPWDRNASSLLRPADSGHMLTYSEMLDNEAELDQILREVIAESDISNERLRVCVAFLEDWPEKRFSHAGWLVAAYRRDQYWLQYGPVDERYAKYRFHTKPLPLEYRWFSFERTRMLKKLYRVYQIAVERADRYEKAVLEDQPVERLHRYEGLLNEWDIIPYQPAKPIWYQLPTTELVRSDPDEEGFHLLEHVVAINWYWDDPFYTAEAQRRGTILYIALRMYFNDHGRLPDSLDELVEDDYLKRLPIIPALCEPFCYEREPSEDRFARLIEALYDPENEKSRLVSLYTKPLKGHDRSAPFLWYPLRSNSGLDPYSNPGWFIDLDFVKSDEE